MGRMEIMTGPERRGSWSEEQKRAIVAAASAGVVIATVLPPASPRRERTMPWSTRPTLSSSRANRVSEPIEKSSTWLGGGSLKREDLHGLC